MWTDSNKTQINNFFSEDKVVRDKIEYPVENQISDSHHTVAKKLQTNDTFKGWIKRVDYVADKLSDKYKYSSHSYNGGVT